MGRAYKVLVVDDSPFVWKAIKKAMEPEEGYELLEQAFNGKMGLEMVERFKPDLIFLDITMPEMDGLQAAEILLRKDPGIRIVLISAMGDKLILDKAKQLGIKAFLPKPFKPEEVIQQLRSLLAPAAG